MAVRDINLLDEGILERRYIIRHACLWGAGLAIVIILITGGYGYQSHVFAALRQQMPGRQGGLPNLAALVGEIQKRQGELRAVLQERTQLGRLTEQRHSYSAVLAKLAEIMDDRTWLSQLSFDIEPGNRVKAQLTGNSLSHDSLGGFMQRLSGEPAFRGVVLKYAQETEAATGEGKQVQFQIECSIAEIGS